MIWIIAAFVLGICVGFAIVAIYSLIVMARWSQQDEDEFRKAMDRNKPHWGENTQPGMYWDWERDE